MTIRDLVCHIQGVDVAQVWRGNALVFEGDPADVLDSCLADTNIQSVIPCTAYGKNHDIIINLTIEIY